MEDCSVWGEASFRNAWWLFLVGFLALLGITWLGVCLYWQFQAWRALQERQVDVLSALARSLDAVAWAVFASSGQPSHCASGPTWRLQGRPSRCHFGVEATIHGSLAKQSQGAGSEPPGVATAPKCHLVAVYL